MRAAAAGLAMWCCVGLAGDAVPAEDLATLCARVVELYHKGDYPGAVTLAERAVEVAERQHGTDAVETATSLNNLAALHVARGDPARAVPLYERARGIFEKSLGPDHPDTAGSLSNLALLYHAQGQYALAEPLLTRALAIKERASGPEHPDTAMCLNNLAGLHESQGRYALAGPLYDRALAIHEKSLGPDHPHTAQSVNNLALLHHRLGRPDVVEPLLKRALAIRERALGPDHPDTAQSLHNLAAFYDDQGRPALAEPLYARALAIWEKSLGPEHPHVAMSVNGLGALHKSQGHYDIAEAFYRRALVIREKSLGPDHPRTAASLGNLASLHEAQGEHALAKTLHERAVAIRRKSLGPDHPDTAQSLDDLGLLHCMRGEFVQAESLHEQALAIREAALGPDHPATADTLHNLAGLHARQGRHASAEQPLKRALAIREAVLGPDHPQTALSLDSLAGSAAALGRVADAAALFDRSRRGRRRHIAGVLPSLSAAEQARFLKAQDAGALHGALTLGLLGRTTPQLASLSAGWLANGKAVAQEAASQRIILARQGATAATRDAVAALVRIRGDLARLSQVTPAAREAEAHRSSLAELLAEEHRLIHEIGGQLAVIDRAEPWVEIDEIRRGIPAGGVLVDIARFDIFDFEVTGRDNAWRPARYAAWIIPPAGGGDVTIVDLGDAGEVDRLVADYRRAIEDRLGDPPAATSLAARTLRPIVTALPTGGGAVEELILSPDGALWLVPWQALPLDDGTFAIERYAIRTVTSGRDLAPPPEGATPRERPAAPMIVADPAFDERPGPGEPAAVDPTPVAGLVESAGRLLTKVPALPATRREAEAATVALTRVTGVAPAVRVGRDATAAAVQRDAVRPQVLVLATHGFFLPDQRVAHDDRLAPAHSRGIAGIRPVDTGSGAPVEDPLLRCGLLFTGANLPAAVPADGDDGVLTGAEIVGLDLLGTDLVVLSACDTGLGRVDVGEGVAGLRQAFQIAGARSVVATLWQVPDEESADIMAAFYAALAAGQPASRALRAAQLDFIARSREAGSPGADHPYLWAAYGTTGR